MKPEDFSVSLVFSRLFSSSLVVSRRLSSASIGARLHSSPFVRVHLLPSQAVSDRSPESGSTAQATSDFASSARGASRCVTGASTVDRSTVSSVGTETPHVRPEGRASPQGIAPHDDELRSPSNDDDVGRIDSDWDGGRRLTTASPGYVVRALSPHDRSVAVMLSSLDLRAPVGRTPQSLNLIDDGCKRKVTKWRDSVGRWRIRTHVLGTRYEPRVSCRCIPLARNRRRPSKST